MAVWAKNPITGYGVLFFGIRPESRSDYEIELIKENDTPMKVSGRFYGSVEVPEHMDKSKAMLELQEGERIKILIFGDPKFSPINFVVVDKESIAICSNLRP
jgi:hypothetical protein